MTISEFGPCGAVAALCGAFAVVVGLRWGRGAGVAVGVAGVWGAGHKKRPALRAPVALWAWVRSWGQVRQVSRLGGLAGGHR